MKKICLVCLFTGILIFHAQGIFPQQAQDLVWDIQLQTGGKGEAIPDSQTITVEKGQAFSIVISPDSDSFFYVLSQNSKRRFAVLHDQSVSSGNEIVLNPLQADNSSDKKTLYVIVSVERQTKLEGLIKTYLKNPKSSRYSTDLQNEIAGLQNRASSIGQDLAITISTGGTTRGSADDDYATRFSGKNMYVKAFTINAASTNS